MATSSRQSEAPAAEHREVTVFSVTLGVLLAVLFCAANAYLGLKAGVTVSASIPAAVVSMGLFRLLRTTVRRRGTILENNLVQTITSTGETLAGGVIFTLPALVLTGAWTGFDYWTVTLIAMSGGLLGILFMIPLRKVLIASETSELAYPEGVACAEVLKTGERGGSGVALVAGALGVAAIFKALSGGIRVVRGSVEGILPVGRAGFYVGAELSPALLGVGYIVGLNVALLIFIGGSLGWLVGVPLVLAMDDPGPGSLLDRAWEVWRTRIRYVGVGGMVVGGLWSIVSIRHGIARGVEEVLGRFRRGPDNGEHVPRTARDMRSGEILLLLTATLIVVFFLYRHLTGSAGVAFLTTGVMVITAFFFVAVSSYIAGLVGSSNTPWSGMTVCALLLTALVLHVSGYGGMNAVLATLGVASVVCVAVANASDISQDLKTGYLVKATPRAQQWGEVIGAVVPAFFLAPILTLLHAAYGIGTGTPESLQAPQATLFASLASAIFLGTERIPQEMVAIGVVLAVVVVAADAGLRRARAPFRLHVMPVVVGLYLPFTVATAILLGGLASQLANRLVRRRPEPERIEARHRGVLVSSGLIAGEAVMGILLAIPIALGVSLPITVLDSSAVSLLAFAGVIVLLLRAAAGRRAVGP